MQNILVKLVKNSTVIGFFTIKRMINFVKILKKKRAFFIKCLRRVDCRLNAYKHSIQPKCATKACFQTFSGARCDTSSRPRTLTLCHDIWFGYPHYCLHSAVTRSFAAAFHQMLQTSLKVIADWDQNCKCQSDSTPQVHYGCRGEVGFEITSHTYNCYTR